jgi:sec-independent protein translocase protein TatB
VGNLGFAEMLVIAVVALLVFGPDRLPELARQAGKAIARFRSETSKSIEELKRAADIEDLERELKGLSKDVRDIRRNAGKALMESGTPARAEDRPPPTDPEAT